MPEGASVWIIIRGEDFGKLLHALEYTPEVHIISNEKTAAGSMYRLLLRSDLFPSDWNWKHVTGTISKRSVRFCITKAHRKD